MLAEIESTISQISDVGLIDAAAIRTLIERLGDEQRPKTKHELLAVLVEHKLLTPYQVERIECSGGPPLVLDNYVILDHIGSGGMGQVFKAEHRRMERIVALKLLREQSIDCDETLRRFRQEVKAAARLNHPNIVTAFDADEADGRHFLVMEFVEGRDLRWIAQRRNLSAGAVVGYMMQTARGLQYAHEKGVVHRDIKPSNLLLDADEHVKILDMGIARVEPNANHGVLAETQAQLTDAGIVMGTVDFMAPEQAANTKNADARSDIYSLGCTLYFLLAGEPAYSGETVVEKIFAHRDVPVPTLSGRRDDVPKTLDQVLAKMMAKRPENRFQSMTEVIAALDSHAAQATTRSLDIGGEIATRSPHGSSQQEASEQMPDGERKLQLFIDGCGGHDGFLDRAEEESIFRKGGELELSLEAIERLLARRAHYHGWTRQSKLNHELTERLQQATHGDGAIDRAEFDQIIDYAVGRKMPRRAAEEHCLTLMLDNRWQPKERLFDKWFRRKLKAYGLD